MNKKDHTPSTYQYEVCKWINKQIDCEHQLDTLYA